MSITIMRGSTPTIKMRPLTNDILVSDLGTPAVAITQDMVYLNPEVTVNTTDNYISFTLTEEETLQLVPGVSTYIQQIWKDENTGNVIRFPLHELIVGDTLISAFDDTEDNTPVEEPETFVDETVQIPEQEDEDDSEEPERPLIWDEEEEDSDVEVDGDFGEYQIYDE